MYTINKKNYLGASTRFNIKQFIFYKFDLLQLVLICVQLMKVYEIVSMKSLFNY